MTQHNPRTICSVCEAELKQEYIIFLQLFRYSLIVILDQLCLFSRSFDYKKIILKSFSSPWFYFPECLPGESLLYLLRGLILLNFVNFGGLLLLL